MTSSSPIFDYIKGDSPLIVSMPHSGVELSAGLASRLVPQAIAVVDTDWHLPILYDFLDDLGATHIIARHSRYVIDLNRPPDGKSLYPGKATTGLCPTSFSNGGPLYLKGQEPSPDEIAERRQAYWQPYHDALATEIERVKAKHGYALFWDAHSIKSILPRLFEGRLPDINLGTAKGASMTEPERDMFQDICQKLASKHGYSQILDGRFIGGYITRHYGQPDKQVSAIQMELCQRCYMNEDFPFEFDKNRADKIRPVLYGLMKAWLDHYKG